MPGRTIAIGDIHGCLAALDALVTCLQPQADDQLIFLGDYIDRGPDSRGVIDRLIELRSRYRTTTLLGNHEVMLLEAVDSPDAFANWQRYGGKQMLESYGGGMDQIPKEHWDFVRGLPIYHETERHFFIHANYNAELELKDQPEVTALWEHCNFLVPKRHRSGKTAVVGHTAQKSGEVLNLGHLICIDTYCHGGGWLTALEVETGETWQADRNGRVRD